MTSGGAFRDVLALASSDGEGGSDKTNVRRSDPLRPIHRLLRLVLPAPADTNSPEHDTRAKSMTYALKWDWQDEEVLPSILLMYGALLVGSLVGSTSTMAPTSAAAQTPGDAGGPSLIERYQRARQRALARRHLRQEGRLPVHPPVQVPTPIDSLRPAPSTQAESTEPEPSFPLHDVRPVRRLERNWFREKFADTEWAFLGETSHHAFLDTARTPGLRARLQTAFGDPTQTLVDTPLEMPPDKQAQFEYWFVVNDSIPVQVTDASGPRDRGLIIAVERPFRSQLQALRDTLLAPLRHAERTPYVDYYYDEQRERWYRAGFDGQSFFLKQIPRTNVTPGQRAVLDTTRTSEPSPPSDENSP